MTEAFSDKRDEVDMNLRGTTLFGNFLPTQRTSSNVLLCNGRTRSDLLFRSAGQLRED